MPVQTVALFADTTRAAALLLELYTPPVGRPLQLLMDLLARAQPDDVDLSQYQIMPKGRGAVVRDGMVLPGSYAVVPYTKRTTEQPDGLPVLQPRPLDTTLHIIPRGGAGEGLSGQTTSSTASRRSGLFRTTLERRDSVCVLTGAESRLRACHILARSYWSPENINKLPEPIFTLVDELPGLIGSVSNGLQMRRDYGDAFDLGAFGFHHLEGARYQVVAFDATAREYDEDVVEFRSGPVHPRRSDRWEEQAPSQILLNFHLTLCVWRRLRAQAEPDDDDHLGQLYMKLADERARVTVELGGDHMAEEIASDLGVPDVALRAI